MSVVTFDPDKWTNARWRHIPEAQIAGLHARVIRLTASGRFRMDP
jgi:hypothetical protein